MKISGIQEIPSGLIKKVKTPNYENIELRATLEKAVDDADLNVTERWALNRKFYPKGGGFELFPDGKKTAEFSYYLKPNQSDSFEKILKDMDIAVPERIGISIDKVQIRKSADIYRDNLASALKKLGTLLKGKI